MQMMQILKRMVLTTDIGADLRMMITPSGLDILMVINLPATRKATIGLLLKQLCSLSSRNGWQSHRRLSRLRRLRLHLFRYPHQPAERRERCAMGRRYLPPYVCLGFPKYPGRLHRCGQRHRCCPEGGRRPLCKL